MDTRTLLLERAKIRQALAEKRSRAKREWTAIHSPRNGTFHSMGAPNWLWKALVSFPAGFLLKNLSKKVSHLLG